MRDAGAFVNAQAANAGAAHIEHRAISALSMDSRVTPARTSLAARSWPPARIPK